MTNRYRTARRLIVMSVASMVAALGCIALGYSAVATAEPVWDIEDFDYCAEILNDGLNESWQEKLDDTRYCCEKTGGVWNEGQANCQAPAPEGAEAIGPTRPLRPLPAGVDESKVPVAPPPTTTTGRPLPGLPPVPILPPVG